MGGIIGRRISPRQLRLLSHNVFWFQGYPFSANRPSEPRTEVLYSLCKLYRDLSADVICLQEVQSKETLEKICSWTGMSGCYCPGGDLPQYGGAVLWHGNGARLVTDSSLSNAEMQRMFQVVEVGEKGSSLQICNIHLPSQRQLDPRVAARKRISELMEAIGSGIDIVMGDLNEGPGGEVAEWLQKMGFLDSAELLGHANTPTSLGGGRGDYIWVKELLSNHISEYGVVKREALNACCCEKKYLSDHLPIWVSWNC